MVFIKMSSIGYQCVAQGIHDPNQPLSWLAIENEYNPDSKVIFITVNFLRISVNFMYENVEMFDLIISTTQDVL